MTPIFGNTVGLIQVKSSVGRNTIGEETHEWVDAVSLPGYLDYASGDSNLTYNAKLQETTHYFFCDFRPLQDLGTGWIWDPFSFVDGVITSTEQGVDVDVTSENGRMVINGNIYQILLIDDPMGMHEHLEIYLKYIGGGLGV